LRRATSTPTGAQQAVGQRSDLVREGRREQQVLAAGGEQREDPADVADEAHVQHPVGLIQHENLDAAQVKCPLPDMIKQAARRGDQDIHTLPQRLSLRGDVDPAEDHRGGQRQVSAVNAHALLDLGGQFARRRQNQGAHEPARRRRVCRRRQALQERQREGGRLAGARLRPRQHVAPLQDGWDGLGLNRRRRLVALVGEGAQEFGAQAERGERRGARRGGGGRHTDSIPELEPGLARAGYNKREVLAWIVAFFSRN